MNQQRTSLIASLTLSTSIATAMMLASVALVRFVTTTLSTFSVGDSVSYGLSFEGDVPVIQVSRFENGEYVKVYTDIQGNQRDAPTSSTLVSQATLSSRQPWTMQHEADSDFYRVRSIAQLREEKERWFLVHDGTEAGGVWFECYSETANRRVTCLGRTGPSESVPPPEDRFPIRLRDLIQTSRFVTPHGTKFLDVHRTNSVHPFLYFADAERFYQIDVLKKTLTNICELPAGTRSVSATLQGEYTEARFRGREREFDPTEWYLFARTNNSIIRMNALGEERLRISLPPESHGDGSVTYNERLDGRPLLMTSFTKPGHNFSDGFGTIFNVADSGELIDRQDYAWRNEYAGMSKTSEDIATALTAPCVLVAGGTAVSGEIFRTKWTLQRMWLAIPLALLSGGVAVWLCVRHQTAHSAPNRTFWLVFVFLLGIFGYFGYRFHRRWVPAELLIDSAESFSQPAATGIEVFG